MLGINKGLIFKVQRLTGKPFAPAARRSLNFTVGFKNIAATHPASEKNIAKDTQEKKDVFVGKVIANKDITQDDQVHRVVFEVQNKFTWENGQAVGIVTNAPSDDALKGKPGKENDKHTREYSIASAYQPKGPLATIVRRFNPIDFPGRASNALCDAKLGDSFKLLAPKNTALVLRGEEKNKNLVAICGGTGIAPFLAHLPDRKVSPGTTVIFYGVKDEPNFIEREQIEDFAYHTPNAKVLVAYSTEVPSERLTEKTNPQHTNHQKALLENLPDIGYRKKAYIQDVVLERKDNVIKMLEDNDTLFLFCGGNSMQKGVEKVLTEICKETDTPWETRKANLLAQGRWKAESA